MSAQKLITEHLDLWTGAITSRSSSGRGNNSKIELAGIKALRDLILELALSGKLVDPKHGDESAHELLSKIKGEKSRLTAKGVIRATKVPGDSISSPPYSVPGHWCWARLGDVTNYGTTDKAEPNQVANDTWVLELEDVEKESSKLLSKVRYKERQFKSSKNRFECGDVLYGKLRPYLDKVLVADEPGVCTTEIIPIRSHQGLLSEFLRLALKSPSFRRYANNSTHGMNLPRLGTDKARMAIIPIAPTAEQRRIVQKVDELMTLCDRLEQQTSDQLEAHETLVDTLLGTLTQSETATDLADNWARLATHFDTLFTTEQSIEKLKQTILQLAVMGRLVEQDNEDEPAAKLLECIEHLRHRESGSKRNSRPLPPVEKLEQMFNVPEGWCWVRVGHLANVKGGKRLPKGQALTRTPTKHAYIRVTDMKAGSVLLDDIHYISNETYEAIKQYTISKDDLYITIAGTIGAVGEIPEVLDRMNLTENAAKLVRIGNVMDKRFLLLALSSSYSQAQLLDRVNQMAQPKLALHRIESTALAIPPIKEQQRIVKKTDELMTLCEQLKERLNQASETRCQLADAIVEGALH